MKKRAITRNTTRKQRSSLPGWASFAVVITIALMLCTTINYRAFSLLGQEKHEFDQLTNKVRAVTDENLQLQEEIHDLKSDPKTVEREAKRLGMTLKRE